jgi:hypothetical protein
MVVVIMIPLPLLLPLLHPVTPLTFRGEVYTETLTIDKNLTIQGAGAGSTIIQAAASRNTASDSVFTITGGPVTIEGVTIRYGNSSDGGGINNSAGGDLTINNSIIRENDASDEGGIYNDGSLTINDSTITGNNTKYGGGIHNNATLTVNNSLISNNEARFGGGLSNNNNTQTTINACIIENNTSTAGAGAGGGFYNKGTLNLNHSVVLRNVGTSAGGIENKSGSITMTNTIVIENTGDSLAQNDCAGTLTSTGNNVVGNGTGCPSNGSGDKTIDEVNRLNLNRSTTYFLGRGGSKCFTWYCHSSKNR